MVDRERPAELAVPDPTSSSPAARATSAADGRAAAFLSATWRAEWVAQFGHTGTRLGRGRQHRHPRQPLGGEQPTEIVQTAVAIGLGQPIRLVQDHDHDVGVPGERFEVAVVQGGVRVLRGSTTQTSTSTSWTSRSTSSRWLSSVES